MAEKAHTMQIDIELVRQLADLLTETGLTEIEVEDSDRKIKVARHAGGAASVQVAAPAPVAALAAAPAPVAAPADHPGTVKSPMVGTVYLASSPDSANFVGIGDSVKEGDTLVIIEAMKVMNPIIAPRGGKVTAILVANAQPVEYDQPLVTVE
jgi:acetyl-CoA carboxylase biotin carboxyl carrier protein